MALEIQNLNYTIEGKRILRNINLTINSGDRIAICGPNGAGKSTLMNLILNIPSTTFSKRTHEISGGIKNSLFDIKSYKDVKIHLQHSKISYNLYLKVKELLNLCFDGNIPYGLLDEFDLSDKMENLVRSLSGGEYQKLNIILAIASNPRVLFLDEITTGLDYETKKKIVAYIKNYLSTGQGTLVFVTHYLEEISELAEKICFINNGEIVDFGELDQLYNKYNIASRDINELYEEVVVRGKSF